MFKMDSREQKHLEEIRDEVRKVSAKLSDLQGQRSTVQEELELSDEIKDLKRQIADLGIGKSKLTEDHARKVREVEHKVGLQQKRQDFEVDAAKRDAQLSVREESLQAEKDRFEKQMDFITQRFGQEVTYLKEIMGDILLRLPNVDVSMNGNGRKAGVGVSEDE